MIEIINLRCSYNGTEVLKELSLKIETGDFTGIIGPNGAGKTSLVRCILKLLNYKGEIRIDGNDLKNYDQLALSKKISYLPSEIYSIYNYSVYEIIAMGRFPYNRFSLKTYSTDNSMIEKYLEYMELQHLKNRRINTLSSGERQLVFLTQLLVQETEIIILDEPTSHLDITHQIKIFDILKKLNDEKKITIIFINHDINTTTYYAKKVVMMKDGRCYFYGVPSEIITENNINEIYSIQGESKYCVTTNLNGKPVVYLSDL